MTDKLRHLWLTAAAILALASCSQDDMGEGGSPYDGDSPVVFSATGITPLGTTRATVDGTWEGTEKVTVRVGFGVKKTYVVKASSDDKKSATLEAASGVEPFKWSEVEGNAVEAYTTDNVLDDQSTLENYRASDWLHASVNNMTRTSVLNFEHQVARVVITVSNGDFANDEVKLVVGDRTITPYCDEDNSRYLAIVESGSERPSVKIKHGGKDYIYTYTTSEKLMGGNSYTVNVKIDKTMHITDEATLKAWAEAVKKDPTVSAIVDNDFSMSNNWEPVVNFSGTFDGNSKTITGLVVNDNKTNYVGFICDNNGTVKNLTLENVMMTGYSTGAVAGMNNGIIENCHVTGNSVIKGSINYAGGVAGTNSKKILACHVAKECTVEGHNDVGGIVGYHYSSSSEITGCYALCSLIGKNVGGIVGNHNLAPLTACYSKCSYNSSGSNDSYVGGIIGELYREVFGTIKACYWLGDLDRGVGNRMSTATVDGVWQIYNMTWARVANEMNIGMNGYDYEELEGTGYKYVENSDASTSDDEPLVLVKTQQ